jgi:mono/diheme cytochrome c family protein
MSRLTRSTPVLCLAAAVIAGSAATPAFAIKQFFDEFKAMYVKDGTPLAEAVGTAKCNVCHKGSSKKERNAYGEALDALLDKKADAKNVEKIKEALEKVAAMPSKAGGPTFGELIEKGELPATE